MLTKIILLFLIAMGALALFGRLRFPGPLGKRSKLRPKTCPKCGRHLIGKGDCICSKEG